MSRMVTLARASQHVRFTASDTSDGSIMLLNSFALRRFLFWPVSKQGTVEQGSLVTQMPHGFQMFQDKLATHQVWTNCSWPTLEEAIDRLPDGQGKCPATELVTMMSACSAFDHVWQEHSERSSSQR